MLRPLALAAGKYPHIKVCRCVYSGAFLWLRRLIYILRCAERCLYPLAYTVYLPDLHFHCDINSRRSSPEKQQHRSFGQSNQCIHCTEPLEVVSYQQSVLVSSVGIV